MNNITIQEWNEQQFRDSRNSWNALLERSNSDPLFLSWEWQHTWWDVFSEPEQMQLKLFVALDSNGKLVGIAPLYLSKAKSKKFVTTRRLQFLGNCWHGKTTMRTELLDFITDKSISNKIVTAFFSHIYALTYWDELILTDLKKDSDTYQLLTSENLLSNCYYRSPDEYDSFFVNTNVSFDSYVKSLGKNTRLRLVNRRKILDTLGHVHFESDVTGDIENQFKLLNHLHSKRWGKPVFQNERLLFNETVAKLMAQRGALSFSLISIDNNPVSIQYNYNTDGHKYNIQAGFDENIHKKIALGYLHFGYEIEHACANKITAYDFLAGDGKNTPYKKQLTESKIQIVNLQIIRKPIVKMLYRLYDYFKK